MAESLELAMWTCIGLQDLLGPMAVFAKPARCKPHTARAEGVLRFITMQSENNHRGVEQLTVLHSIRAEPPSDSMPCATCVTALTQKWRAKIFRVRVRINSTLVRGTMRKPFPTRLQNSHIQCKPPRKVAICHYKF